MHLGIKLTYMTVHRREGHCRHEEGRGADPTLGTLCMRALHWEDKSPKDWALKWEDRFPKY